MSDQTQEPRMWFVKDFADGWIAFDNEADAKREVEATDAMMMLGYQFPCGVSPSVSALQAEIATLREENERLTGANEWRSAFIKWLRNGYREMSQWSSEEAANRTRQYSLDTLTGPTGDKIHAILAERQAKAALEPRT